MDLSPEPTLAAQLGNLITVAERRFADLEHHFNDRLVGAVKEGVAYIRKQVEDEINALRTQNAELNTRLQQFQERTGNLSEESLRDFHDRLAALSSNAPAPQPPAAPARTIPTPAPASEGAPEARRPDASISPSADEDSSSHQDQPQQAAA